ncbi:MAG: PAS domain-containing sensor histidine kinase, partial [Silvanigrellaceae bacterium]|nr:PAS domain-containing sensor histidine kinase [Silvanigrellaceae bacterium]
LIYWKDLSLRYMIFNKNVVQLSGLSKEELLGKNDLELNWGTREAESFRRDDREIITTGISKTTEYEVPIKRSDDNYMIVRTVKSPLFDKNGKTTGILAVAIDVTDQKILEKSLVQARDRIEKLDKIKTDFIRNMEHDIRTPFTGLETLSGILEEQEVDEDKKVLMSAINQSAKELLGYCNTILDFSKIEAGSLPILEKKFNMKELINQIISLEKAALEAKKHKVQINYEDKLPTIFIGDSYRIERILVNLVSNAIKFTQEGEIFISVNLAKVINNREYLIKLSVEDNGIGIAEDKISQIYEKFSRLTLSNQAQYKGMGLGLSIVKNLLADLEGEIDVESQLSKGSIFTCTFVLKVPLEHSCEG